MLPAQPGLQKTVFVWAGVLCNHKL